MEKQELTAEHSLKHIPQFEVLERLGEGGMGIVYSVRDRNLHCVQAIKVLRPEVVADKARLKRFEQEAKATAQLTHPNIGQVFGLALDDQSSPYLLMEYIEGETLGHLLRYKKFLSPERAIGIFIQVAKALEHAHSRGVIHRDLKPSNIMITEQVDGTDGVKLVDFGIAKLNQSEAIIGLTQTGEVFGSPQYMSPEQCRGLKTDERSDIYSMGCVLFETMSMVPLVEGVNPVQIMLQHIEGSGKKRLKKCKEAGIRGDMLEVIMKMTAKKPENRYQKASEVLQDLLSLRNKQTPGFVVVKRTKKLLAAALIALMVLFSAFEILKRVESFEHVRQAEKIRIESAQALGVVAIPVSQYHDDLARLTSPELILQAFGRQVNANALVQQSHDEVAKAHALRDLRNLRKETIARIRELNGEILPTLARYAGTSETVPAGKEISSLCTHLLGEHGALSVGFVMDVLAKNNKTGAELDERLINVLRCFASESTKSCLEWIASSDKTRQMAGAEILAKIIEGQNKGSNSSYSHYVPASAPETLLRAFKNTHSQREKAFLLSSLGLLEPNAQLLKALEQLATDEKDPFVRSCIVRSLGSAISNMPADQVIVDVMFLGSMLRKDPDASVRLQAAAGLQFACKQATPALPLVIDAYKYDKSSPVRREALTVASLNDSCPVSLIKIALKSPDQYVVHAALDAVCLRAEKLKEASPELLDLLKSTKGLPNELFGAARSMAPYMPSSAGNILFNRVMQATSESQRQQEFQLLESMGAQAENLQQKAVDAYPSLYWYRR